MGWNFTVFDINLVKSSIVSEFQNMEMESFSTQETLIRTSKCFELSLYFSDCFVATATLSKQKILTRRIPQYGIRQGVI